jgi:hypothetical protein
MTVSLLGMATRFGMAARFWKGCGFGRDWLVFERGQLDGVDGALVAAGVVAQARVAVAEGSACEGRGVALAAAGEDVAALFVG